MHFCEGWHHLQPCKLYNPEHTQLHVGHFSSNPKPEFTSTTDALWASLRHDQLFAVPFNVIPYLYGTGADKNRTQIVAGINSKKARMRRHV
jgi:hypothetical protein